MRRRRDHYITRMRCQIRFLCSSVYIPVILDVWGGCADELAEVIFARVRGIKDMPCTFGTRCSKSGPLDVLCVFMFVYIGLSGNIEICVCVCALTQSANTCDFKKNTYIILKQSKSARNIICVYDNNMTTIIMQSLIDTAHTNLKNTDDTIRR